MKNAKGIEVKSERAWIDDSAPAKRISAYVILNKPQKGRDLPPIAGKILVLRSREGMGRLTVNLYDWAIPSEGSEVYYGWSTGCGYDKLSAALDGLKFGEHVFLDLGGDNLKTWDEQLRAWGYDSRQVI